MAVDTLELKKKMIQLEEFRENEKLWKKKADDLEKEVEDECSKIYEGNKLDNIYHDENVHIEKSISATSKIDSGRVLKECPEVVEAISTGHLTVTLNASKTSKILKDHGYSPNEYMTQSLKESFKYHPVDDNEEEEPF